MANRDSIVNTAKPQIGVTESPAGSNQTRYGVEYGMNGVAWCAIFVWWVYKANEIDLRHELTPKWAYTPAGLQAARAKGWAVSVNQANAGDIVFFDFPGGEGVDHVGIVVSNDGRGTLQTIEGNTSAGTAGSQSNGGGVFYRSRSYSVVAGTVRVAGVGDAAPPASDPAAIRHRAAGTLLPMIQSMPNLDGGNVGANASIHVANLRKGLDLVNATSISSNHTNEQMVQYGQDVIDGVLLFQQNMNRIAPGSIKDFPGAAHETTRWFLAIALENIRDGKA
jgi:hypothetical protein